MYVHITNTLMKIFIDLNIAFLYILQKMAPFGYVLYTENVLVGYGSTGC